MTSVAEGLGRRGGAPGALLRRAGLWLARRPAQALAGLVAVSAVTRMAVAWQHTLPRYFPDEYIYTALARSIADGELAIRGTPARFPALLEPLLAAPFALTGDPELAYRLTQALHATAMSLAAVPVYLLARRVSVAAGPALVVAALSVTLPALVLSAYVTADAVAYPVVLAALWAGVRAVDRPSARAQLLFLALAGLACFARVQYVVLVPAFLATSALVGGADGRRAHRSFRLTWGLVAGALLAAVALGPSRLLGYYDGVLDLSLPLGSIGRWMAVDAMLLAFASGVVLVPAALVGLGRGLRRRAPRAERAFSSVVTVFALLLLLEAGLYAANGSDRFQERYLVSLLPLVPVAFAVGMRGLTTTGARLVAALAGGMLVLAVRVPLTDYTYGPGTQDSPFLQAVARVEAALTHSNGALLLAIASSVLALVAAACSLRPRHAPVALALAACATVPMAVMAARADIATSARMSATYTLAGDPAWVDGAGVDGAAVLVPPGAERGNVSSILFWNTSVTDVLALRGAPGVDAFGTLTTRVADDGRLLADGRPVRRAVAVEESFTQVVLDDAELLRRTPTASLWRPAREARVAASFIGRYVDGWLDRGASVTVWPTATGPRRVVVRLRLSLPAGVPDQEITVGAGPDATRVVVRGGETRVVSVPVAADGGPVTLPVRGATSFALGDRVVTVQTSRLGLVEPGAPTPARTVTQ